MHSQYDGSQQIIGPGAQNMTSQDGSFIVYEQCDESLCFTLNDGTFILAERHAGRAILYFVLLKLLLGFTNMRERRVGIDAPGNDAVIERLRITAESVMDSQFALL